MKNLILPLLFISVAWPTCQKKGQLFFESAWNDNSDKYNVSVYLKKSAYNFELEICQFTSNGQLVKRMVDFERKCDADLELKIDTMDIRIEDIDENGVKEFSIFYLKGCRFDLSPLDAKLLILEGGKKYAVRGFGGISSPYQKQNVKPIIKPGKAFLTLSEVLRDYYSILWKRLAIEKIN
jgi:hypothetical protein